MAVTTKSIRDGVAALFTGRFWDDGTAISPMPVLADGTGSGQLAKAEDAAHNSGDYGIMALGVRKDTAAALGADGDYHPPLFDADGKLWVNATVSAGSTAGDVAHDGVDGGNPVKVGGRARSSEIAAVASDDRTDFVSDLTGKQIVLPYANPENFVSGCISSAMTGTTSTSLIAAPASGLRNYITQITVSNSHATVGTDIIIQDGSGGTTLYVIPAAAVYGGASITFPTPLRQPTTATAIYVANVTTGASTKVSASGYKGV